MLSVCLSVNEDHSQLINSSSPKLQTAPLSLWVTLKYLDSFSSSALRNRLRTSRWQRFLCRPPTSQLRVDLLLDSQWFSRVCLCSSALGDKADLWRVQQHTARRTKQARSGNTQESKHTHTAVFACTDFSTSGFLSLTQWIQCRHLVVNWTEN